MKISQIFMTVAICFILLAAVLGYFYYIKQNTSLENQQMPEKDYSTWEAIQNLTEDEKEEVVQIALNDMEVKEWLNGQPYRVDSVEPFEWTSTDQNGSQTFIHPNVIILLDQTDLYVPVDLNDKKVITVMWNYHKTMTCVELKGNPQNISVSSEIPCIVNIKVIGYEVANETSISLKWKVEAQYPDGSNETNPEALNLTFDPEQLIFPCTLGRLDPPDIMHSDLIIVAAGNARDGNYKVIISGSPDKTKGGGRGYVAPQIISFNISRDEYGI